MDLWEFLGGLIAPASGIIGALGGVALTNRHAATIERTKALRDTRSAAREMFFEFIQTGERWSHLGITSTMSAITAVKGGATVSDDPPRALLEEYNEARLGHVQMSTKIRMFVGDDDLRSQVVELKNSAESVTTVMSPIFEALLDGRTGADRITSAHVNAVFHYFQTYEKGLSEFEASAVRFVVEQIDDTSRHRPSDKP
ncbi:hypothetical protein BMW26_01045 [Microbacterium sp. 1.5R]|uniref:hypothetical protein n=1 Tax=Microbacterium sp. 1.5R TaxID=1916917 RepID=UPI00090A5A35|nr:hypothetical protein [Microbacterium sp. 1.5R]APH43699.1 hypothetical protein BMW26_01045 [Microbacterium sp. 1.5R]